MIRILPRVLAAGLLLLAFLGVSPAALAQPSGDRVTFGVRPATAKAPDQRNAFTYSATPGARITDYLAVSNVGASPVELRIYASDAFNTPEGGFDLLAAKRKPLELGLWAVPGKDSVSVPARSTAIVPFTVTIPANATPGDHAGGIVASLATEQTQANGQKLAVEQRVGARIYARVSGELHPALSITDLSVDYHGSLLGRGEATMSYVVRNTGNVRLSGKQWAKVSTPWGSTVDAPDLAAIPELLPGSSMKMSTKVGGLLPAGWLTGTVHVDPITVTGQADPSAPAAEESATVAAIPWLYLAVFVVLVLALVFWIRRRRRRRGTPTEPEEVTEHADAG
ncbi:WxL protein peptidoglycan domain-containing protein [Amycolatopsis panacis]|uniref:DUF916 domain-containing protein n=1 Tax=Amycolatopsis panacis TaxID=2340917 RepID=A0A419I9R5_9PSEU|nr:DUF916 domain-containing protein [Amycolatopsis panacis]RJQ89630.1 DUF916 domain-containing protein [Amycolatopsis panacis]